MTTEVTLNPSVTNVTVSSTDALSVDLTTSTTTVELANGLILPQSLGTTDSPTFGQVTSNATKLELTDTTTGSTTENPSLELYRNGGAGADGHELGAIKFFGNNDAGTPEKIEYAKIYSEIIDTTDGTEDGSLKFHLMSNGSIEDPVMTLQQFGLIMASGNSIYLGANGTLSFEGTNETNNLETAIVATNPTADRTITLPDATGTVVVGDSVGAITASQTIAVTSDTSIDTTEFAAFVGKKIIYTGGTGEIDLPNAVAGDNGKAWVIINAGTGALTIDIDGSSTAQFVRFLSGGSVDTSNSANRIIAAGGTAEIICIADGNNTSSNPNYLIYGGGIS